MVAALGEGGIDSTVGIVGRHDSGGKEGVTGVKGVMGVAELEVPECPEEVGETDEVGVDKVEEGDADKDVDKG